MEEKGMEKALTTTISNWLSDSKMTIDNITINTNKGVPQGAINSPILFNIFINDLIEVIQDSQTKCLVFADDVAIITEG